MSVRSLNKVMLIGNLTRDPVIRYTPNNSAVCSFSLATNRTWTPSDGGEKQERADYHNIVAWSKLAELCGQLLKKGDKVYVEGRLQTREWKGKDELDHRTTEIIIDTMILLTSRGGERAGGMANDQGMPDEEAAPVASSSKKLVGAATKPSKAAAPKDEEPMSDEVSAVEDVSDDIPF